MTDYKWTPDGAMAFTEATVQELADTCATLGLDPTVTKINYLGCGTHAVALEPDSAVPRLYDPQNPREILAILTPETVRDALLLVPVHTPLDTIRAWSDQQKADTFYWATAVHLAASDNPGVTVPDRPDFIPAEAMP